MKKTPEERFWPKVNVLGPDDCWLWMGATKGVAGKQYGNFWDGQRQIGAHVFAWSLVNGPLPTGSWVLHRCDVMLCVNHRHLFAGTVFDNNRDMMEKDRVKFGQEHWRAKIKEDDIGWIMARIAAGETQYSIAADHDIGQSVVSRIVAGKAWRRAPRSFDPRRELDSLCDYKRWLLRQPDCDIYLQKALTR